MNNMRRKPHGIPYNMAMEALGNQAFQIAWLEFLERVGPREDLSQTQKSRLHSAGIEWFVFDYILPDGRTPLQYCLDENGDKLSSRTRRAFRQSIESQFCSHFNITGLNKGLCSIQLVNAIDGRAFTTYDVSMSNSLRGPFGVIGTRLVQFDSEWLYPGIPVYCINQELSQQDRDKFANTIPESLSFIDLVQIIYS